MSAKRTYRGNLAYLLKYTRTDFRVGTVFSTRVESGCVVTDITEDYPGSNSFCAIDSEGVECSYSFEMVESIERY